MATSIDTKFVKGADKLKARIATIRANLALPVMTEDIGKLLLARTLRRFDREVDPDERPWVPRKEATIERRSRAGFDGEGPLLVQTGALRNAIRLIRGGKGTVSTNTGAGVRIGVQDTEIAKRAGAHQRGYGHIPQRRFLGIGRLDIKAVDSLLRRKAVQLEKL